MANKCENNSSFNKPTVVFAMLDWGLGHVSRSIPIIEYFQQQQWHIVIACDSNQYKLLVSQFPNAEFQTLPGYQISFGKTRVKTLLKIIRQSIKILTKIKFENKWITLFLAERKAQLIVSDNRYGFYHPSVPSVFITHQLKIKSSLGALVDRFLAFLNKKHLQHFDQIWVPDLEDQRLSLGGTLSQTSKSHSLPVHYIGPISRLIPENNLEKKRKYLAILSGPEPQRSILEQSLTNGFKKNKQALTIVCGTVTNPQSSQDDCIERIGYADANQLNKLIASSEYIISRSGYSSLMDYALLGCKAILIPTPGQAEQEYLAKRFADKGWAACLNQGEASFESIEQLVQSTVFQPFHSSQQFNKEQLHQQIKSNLMCLMKVEADAVN